MDLKVERERENTNANTTMQMIPQLLVGSLTAHSIEGGRSSHKPLSRQQAYSSILQPTGCNIQ